MALGAILLTATFLRLFRLDYGQFTSDDQRPWLVALGALKAHTLPRASIVSSIGIANGPAHPLLLMAAAIFTSQPIAGMILVALINAAAVYLLYRFGAEVFGRRAGLIAALLFATGSWAVVLSRQMRPQDLLVPFELLFVWCAARWLLAGRARDLVWAFVWLAVSSQIYVLGLLQLAIMPLVLLLGWRRIRLWPLAAGLVAWAALSAGYAATLAGQLADLGRVGGAAATIDGGSLREALLMIGHKGYQTIAGQAGSVFDATAGFEAWLVVFEGALLALGFAYLVLLAVQTMRAGKPDLAAVHALLLAWMALPVLAFARHAVPLQPYYFVGLLPAAFLSVALLIDRFWSRGGFIVLALLTANGLALAGIFFAVIPGYYPAADYGLPFHYTQDVAARVEALARARSVERVFVDGRYDSAQVLSTTLGLDGIDSAWQEASSPSLAMPAPGGAPALYLNIGAGTETASLLAQRFAGAQILGYLLPGEGVTIRAYSLSAEQVRSATDSVLPDKLDVLAANGLRLEAFGGGRRLTPGQPLHAAIAWSWPGGTRPSQGQYTLFVHLLDAAHQPLAQLELPLLPTAGWRAGERVVQWLDVPVPPSAAAGRYSLDVGLYTTAGTIRQALADGAGKPIGTSLGIGPFIVPPPPAPPLDAAPEAHFDDGIDLVSHQASSAGGRLSLQLTWAARATPSKDYTVFVHVLDGSGKLVAQADSQPLGGAFPTGLWLPGDRVRDPYTLATPPGHYTVELGMYDLATLRRLGPAPVTFAIDVQ